MQKVKKQEPTEQQAEDKNRINISMEIAFLSCCNSEFNFLRNKYFIFCFYRFIDE